MFVTQDKCGNGVLDPGEQCDDGNNISGDGCEADCTNPVCGNRIVDPGERCDDGNNINGDGCEADCTNPVCGNGIIDPGEQCDDGNTSSGDGCGGTCRFEQLVANRGAQRTDCLIEWAVINPANSRGQGVARQECHDGDRMCDADGLVNGECHFRLAVCVNNQDARLPDCTGQGITRYVLDQPRATSPRPVNATNAAAILGAFADLTAVLPSGPSANELVFDPPLRATAPNNCTGTVSYVVPLVGKVAAHARLKARADAGRPHVRDTDVLELTCHAAP
jgi:cysteine-rich repeat protein